MFVLHLVAFFEKWFSKNLISSLLDLVISHFSFHFIFIIGKSYQLYIPKLFSKLLCAKKKMNPKDLENEYAK